MKRAWLFLLFLFAMALLAGPARAAGVDLKNAAEKMGWQLAAQAYTFKDGSFVTACQKSKELGLKYIEFFPKQPFSDEPGKNFATDDKTTPEQRAMIKKALADAGLQAFSYGVVAGLKPDAAMESVCTFAKEMGLQFIDCEPASIEETPALCKMAEKYGLRLAIHNHPAPSKYWSPETVLEAVKASGAPQTLGSCCDTGHFIRSGLNPLESMRKLGKDSIFFFHWKDLNRTLTDDEKNAVKLLAGGSGKPANAAPQAEKKAGGKGGKGKGKGKKAGAVPAPLAMATAALTDKPHDVPWGTGVNDIWAEALQLKQWGWKGILGAEYETWGPEQMDNLRQSFEFMNIVAAGLDEEGWTPLFTDLAQAQAAPGSWTIKDGIIAPVDPKVKKEDIWTREKYGDFILSVEFQCPQDKCNSGVFVRCGDPAQWLNTSIEIQVLQTPEANGKHNTGSIYDVVPVAKNNVKPQGEWNRMVIIGRKNMLYTVVNDEQAACINLDLWTEAGKNPDGTKNKFKTAYKDMPRAGVIGLQCHGDAIHFRNVKIKALD